MTRPDDNSPYFPAEPCMMARRSTLVIQLEDINRRSSRTASQMSMLKIIAFAPLFAAGAILALACIGQGIENNHAYSVAMEDHQ